jgi:hypothetical protein
MDHMESYSRSRFSVKNVFDFESVYDFK